MDIKDFTYGIQAEMRRDLTKALGFFRHIKTTKRPVRITTADSRSFCLFVTGFDDGGKRVRLGNFSEHKLNRVLIPVDYIISVEQILISEVDNDYRGQLTIKRGELEIDGYMPSGRDFFQVIRYAYQQNKSIRVYLSDSRIIEGVSTGMDEQSVGIRLHDGKLTQVFYDWVYQIIPV